MPKEVVTNNGYDTSTSIADFASSVQISGVSLCTFGGYLFHGVGFQYKYGTFT